jgi:hypothetical protein
MLKVKGKMKYTYLTKLETFDFIVFWSDDFRIHNHVDILQNCTAIAQSNALCIELWPRWREFMFLCHSFKFTLLVKIYALIYDNINNDQLLVAYLNHILFYGQVGIYYNEKTEFSISSFREWRHQRWLILSFKNFNFYPQLS